MKESIIRYVAGIWPKSPHLVIANVIFWLQHIIGVEGRYIHLALIVNRLRAAILCIKIYTPIGNLFECCSAAFQRLFVRKFFFNE